jgi:hypothetical protein
MRLSGKAEYNIAEGGTGGATRSKNDGSYGETFRKNLSQGKLKQYENPEEKKKLSEALKIAIKNDPKRLFGGFLWKGRKMSQETRKKISDANSGIKNAQYGKSKTTEEKRIYLKN